MSHSSKGNNAAANRKSPARTLATAWLVTILAALACLLILPALLAAAPPADAQSPGASSTAKNLSNSLPDGSPAPSSATGSAASADSLHTFAGPVPVSQVPLSSGFDYPVGGAGAHEGFEMNNCFSCDWEYYIGHTGEDFDNGREGDPVMAASEGVVTFAGMGPGAWGNVVIVQHNVRGTTIYTQYAHMREFYVAAGQTVGRRQQIGIVGMTGTVAPHLHFEVKDQSLISHGYTGYPFTGLTINYEGINFYAPSWFIDNNRIYDSPFGSVEGTPPIPGGFKVGGWAIDPNTANPIDVHFYLDGVGLGGVNANLSRPDVGAVFPAYGANHGYSYSVAATYGTHELCVFGINTGPGANTLIGCSQVAVTGNPIGELEDLAVEGTQLRAAGWAIDPDSAAPIEVQFYLNNMLAGTATAGDTRDDIAARYAEYGSPHGFDANVQLVAGENRLCAYGVNTGTGANTQIGCRTVQVGLDSLPTTTPPAGRHYYWTYYDSAGSLNWLLFANPAGAASKSFDLNIKNRQMNLGLFGGPAVAGGESLSVAYKGINGGAVVATSLGGEKAIVSQRSLWKGGNSLEEVPGVEERPESSHFYWTWYDNKTRGVFDWVLVANPGASTIYYRIRIGGAQPSAGQVLEGAATGSIAPGQSINSRFNLMSGPLEVETFSDAEMTTPANSIASQRVLTSMGTPAEAFNEVPGIPAGDLASDYLWTWYDNASPGAYDWVLIANPHDYNIYYQITVGGSVPTEMIEGAPTGVIAPGSNVTPRIANLSGGPVEVKTWRDTVDGTVPETSIASQRTIWGPSFEEVPGFPKTALTSNYHWTWYDQFDAGTYDWVHIINTNKELIDYSITVGGAAPSPVVEGAASGTIAASGLVHPRFLKRGGPVEVRAWRTGGNWENVDDRRDVMVSQRVLWHGYFNEVLGTDLG